MNDSKRRAPTWLWILAALIAGYALHAAFSPAPRRAEPTAGAAQGTPARVWSCAMHPHIRRDAPGNCPLCGMDLTPVETNASLATSQALLVVSPEARALMQVETRPVERRRVETELRLVGRVTSDETRRTTLAARVPGRLERLYVDYTGLPVLAGDHLVELYSPELFAAQAELIQAVRSASTANSGRTVLDSARAQLDGARERLANFGMTAEQIAKIEESGQTSSRVTIHAPIGGIVTDKAATEGMYVEIGTPLFTIDDLSRLWVLLEAYESDLPWLRYGQRVTFTTEAHPGELFEGTISFIDPVLDARTRTVKVRVNVDNQSGRLKPEMFVRARVRASLNEGGRVVDPSLAGKHICRMHPEVVSDGPGDCDVCGMDLMRTEELGFVTQELGAEAAPLVIPAAAPLITGRRAVVYVELEGSDSPTFEGREVVLGARAGDVYVVESGLREGERVVVRGNFKIDSALQIQARPSMMNPRAREGAPEHGEMTRVPTPEGLQHELGALWEEYQRLASSLAQDDLERARTAAQALRVRARELSEDQEFVTLRAERLDRAAADLIEAVDLDAARAAFEGLSTHVEELLRRHATDREGQIVRAFCPMAFDGRGASWLQAGEEIRNPYFGALMLNCGEVQESWNAAPGAQR